MRRVVGNCTQSQVRPSSIILACADDNLELIALHWSAFGGAPRERERQLHVNDCTPNCAAGHFDSYPVTVVLSQARPCPDKYDDYRTATVTFTGRRPAGIHATKSKVSLAGCPVRTG